MHLTGAFWMISPLEPAGLGDVGEKVAAEQRDLKVVYIGLHILGEHCVVRTASADSGT